MRLSYVKIQNFRSIANMKLSFDPSCRILVGINESGKSNILRALSLLDPDSKISPDDLREIAPDERPDEFAGVDFSFQLEGEELKARSAAAQQRTLVAPGTNPLLIRHEGLDLTPGDFFTQYSEVLYEVDVRTSKRRVTGWMISEDSKILGDWYRAADGIPDNAAVTLENGSVLPLSQLTLIHSSALIHYSIRKDVVQPITLSDIGSALIFAGANLVLKHLPKCVYWSYSEAQLLPGRIPLEAFAATPSSCEPLRLMFLLAGVSNVTEAIKTATTRQNGIRNLFNRVAERATSHIRRVWHECRKVTIELAQNGDHIEASIKDSHNLYNFSRRSDGFKRLSSGLVLNYG